MDPIMSTFSSAFHTVRTWISASYNIKVMTDSVCLVNIYIIFCSKVNDVLKILISESPPGARAAFRPVRYRRRARAGRDPCIFTVTTTIGTGKRNHLYGELVIFHSGLQAFSEFLP